jgi:hypothetical protein
MPESGFRQEVGHRASFWLGTAHQPKGGLRCPTLLFLETKQFVYDFFRLSVSISWLSIRRIDERTRRNDLLL